MFTVSSCEWHRCSVGQYGDHVDDLVQEALRFTAGAALRLEAARTPVGLTNTEEV